MPSAKLTSVYERALKKRGFLRVAGVDEAGRGPLAGPVVAAACILPPGYRGGEIRDSKLLTPEKRDLLFKRITTSPGVIWAVAFASVQEVDELNILRASLLAMMRAIEQLNPPPDYLLVDGPQLPTSDLPKEGIIRGDGKCLSIAAASILAKVERDRYMMRLADPGYGFAGHKGYSTKEHLEALARLGPCEEHRKTFAPVMKVRRDATTSA